MQVTDRGAKWLCDALSFDHRLLLLSLRANRLTADTEAEFVALMKVPGAMP